MVIIVIILKINACAFCVCMVQSWQKLLWAALAVLNLRTSCCKLTYSFKKYTFPPPTA